MARRHVFGEESLVRRMLIIELRRDRRMSFAAIAGRLGTTSQNIACVIERNAPELMGDRHCVTCDGIIMISGMEHCARCASLIETYGRHDPPTIMRSEEYALGRFRSQIIDDGGHLIWTGAAQLQRGHLPRLTGETLPHRILWMLEGHQRPAPGIALRLACGVKGCIAPAHRCFGVQPLAGRRRDGSSRHVMGAGDHGNIGMMLQEA